MISWAVDPLTGQPTTATARWKKGWDEVSGGGGGGASRASSSAGTGSGSGAPGYGGNYNGLLSRDQADQALNNLSGAGSVLNDNLGTFRAAAANGVMSPEAKAAIIADDTMKAQQVNKQVAADAYKGSGGVPDPFLSAAVASRGANNLGKAIVGANSDIAGLDQQAKLHALDLLAGTGRDITNYKTKEADILDHTETEDEYQRRMDALNRSRANGSVYTGKMYS